MSDKQRTNKMKQLAVSMHIRNQIHKGRQDVLEPFMQGNCHMIACESNERCIAEFGAFVRKADGGGKVAKLLYIDANKFGRMSDDELDCVATFVERITIMDPENTAAIFLMPSLLSKKRSKGGVCLDAAGWLGLPNSF